MSQLRTNSIVPVGGIPAGASGGGIIQVIQSYRTSLLSTSSSTFQDILTASITPRSSSNKILIMCTGQEGTYLGDGNSYSQHTIKRGSTEIYLGDSSGSASRGSAGRYGRQSGYESDAVSFMFLDSPATTSSTTYSWQVKSPRGPTWTVFIGGSIDDTFFGYMRVPTNMILMEVSG